MAYLPTLKTLCNNANGTFIVPKGCMIKNVVIENTNANSVTGGIKVGTTDGGVDVMISLAVEANSLQMIPLATWLLNIFSMTSDTTLYINSIVSWNGAVVNVYFVLQRLT